MDTTPLTISSEFERLFEEARTRVNEISTVDLEQALSNNKELLLIDVRDQDEYANGHIAAATHLSKGWLESKIYQLTDDKNQKIVLYCGGGHRSLLAADNLQKMGYQNVFSMHGGIKAWVREGRDIIK